MNTSSNNRVQQFTADSPLPPDTYEGKWNLLLTYCSLQVRSVLTRSNNNGKKFENTHTNIHAQVIHECKGKYCCLSRKGYLRVPFIDFKRVANLLCFPWIWTYVSRKKLTDLLVVQCDLRLIRSPKCGWTTRVRSAMVPLRGRENIMYFLIFLV